MSNSPSPEVSIDNLDSGQKKQKKTNLYIFLSAIIAGIFIAQLLLLINVYQDSQLQSSPVTTESKTYMHKIKHMTIFNVKEWFHKGLALVKSTPDVEGTEASNQTIEKKPDNADSYTALNSSDSMLKDKGASVEVSNDIKELPSKKNRNLQSKFNPVSLSGKNTIEKRAEKNISTENKIIEKSIINDTNKAYRTFYTIQAGSFKNIIHAERQFNNLIKLLDKIEFNHLRIEKIDKFNVVRFGKFEGYSKALKLIKEIKPYISNAVILEAHIKDENITKLYDR
jgi:phage-related protein